MTAPPPEQGMAKHSKRATVRLDRAKPISRAEYASLRRELAHVREVVESNASALYTIARAYETNLRRCGELQCDLDALRKVIEQLAGIAITPSVTFPFAPPSKLPS